MTRNKLSEQLAIKKQMLAALVVILVTLTVSWFTLNSSIVYVFHIYLLMLSVPAAILVSLVLNVGMRRFDADDDTRDGCLTSSIRIHQSLLNNTVEQTLIFVLTSFAVVSCLPRNHQGMIFVMFGLFILGRATFIIGYLKFPIYRAFGFGLTLVPIVIYIIYIFIRLIMNI